MDVLKHCVHDVYYDTMPNIDTRYSTMITI